MKADKNVQSLLYVYRLTKVHCVCVWCMYPLFFYMNFLVYKSLQASTVCSDRSWVVVKNN